MSAPPPESGHWADISGGPFCARSGPCHLDKLAREHGALEGRPPNLLTPVILPFVGLQHICVGVLVAGQRANLVGTKHANLA